MVLFHGSPHHLEPGTILRPGIELDPPRSTNGADSTSVYVSSSEGYTLDEVLLEDRLGARHLIGYAARNACLWGACCEDEHERSTFVLSCPRRPPDLKPGGSRQSRLRGLR